MYSPYQGFVWEIRQRQKERNERFSRQDLPQQLAGLMDIVASHYSSGVEMSQDGVLIMLEMAHYLLSHKVVYVPTPLAQRLMETSLEVNFENLHVPFHIFEVVFDQDFKIGGYSAPSCLAVVTPDDVTFNAINSCLKQATNDQTAQKRIARGLPVSYHVPEGFKDMATIRFRSPVDNGGICHMTFSSIEDKGKKIDDVIDSLGTYTKSSVGMVKLNDVEREMEKRLMTIVLGVLCYLNTSEPEIEAFKDRNRMSLSAVKPDAVILGKSIERAAPGWHLRKGHWRFLKHERFTRKDPARCVWVRSAEVNKEQKPAIPDPNVESLSP